MESISLNCRKRRPTATVNLTRGKGGKETSLKNSPFSQYVKSREGERVPEPKIRERLSATQASLPSLVKKRKKKGKRRGGTTADRSGKKGGGGGEENHKFKRVLRRPPCEVIYDSREEEKKGKRGGGNIPF